MTFESIRLALRGIGANRMRSALTMLGILIGVGSVIVLVAVGAGSAEASRQRLEGLGSNTLTVSAGGFGFGARGGTQSRSNAIVDADVTALSDRTQAPDVVAAVPVVTGANLTAAYNGASTTPTQVLGTTAEYAKVRNAPVVSGQMFSSGDVDDHTKVIVIGVTVAKNLLGSETDADASSMVGQPVLFGSATYTVIGILKPKGSNGFQDQDDIVLLPYTTLRDNATGNTGTVSQVIVQARSASATTAAQAEVESVLAARHPGSTTNTFRILNQASLLETQNANNRTFTVLLASVAAISLLVGGIGVMNIMLVTVTERTREIGIRKAIGAPKSAIVGQFITEATLLSFLGGVLGVAAGIIGSHFRIVGIKPYVQPYSVLLAVGVAVAVGLFFGIYPASRAASLRPIEALRYE
jgi:putative ABC transport system permease protein